MAPVQILTTRRVDEAPAITACRMTGSPRLESLLDLGSMALTGMFQPPDVEVPRSPLELVLCPDGGLVQLRHSYDPTVMYGRHYGYRSGLNRSMVRHLEGIAAHLEIVRPLHVGDIVLDIGSNDGTLLGAYREPRLLHLIGMDPTASKFAAFYPPHVRAVPELFSEAAYRRTVGSKQAALVTSIAMFYDLEDPLAFMQAISRILADDGLWYAEQSYLPALLDQCAYDTICHEHLEYYSLTQLAWMADRADLQIVNVTQDATNGGSFAVTFAKRGAVPVQVPVVEAMLSTEAARGLCNRDAFTGFLDAVAAHRTALPALIRSLKADGKTVFGYGASTKGNVLLHACGLTADDLTCIADVNPDKHGCVTPGTQIPIVSEAEAHARRPDYFVVFPWHFRDTIVAREQAFLARGGRLIFPLPQISVEAAS